MKTAREWFETFPEPYRSQALENCTDSDELHETDSKALAFNFNWEGSPQKDDYWYKFWEQLRIENK